MQLLALLLEVLEILLLLLQFLAQGTNLSGLACGSELSTLLGIVAGTLVSSETVLKAHGLDDHDVSAVEDEGEEEGEAAEVHVTLRVELASLDFETFVTEDSGTVRKQWLELCCSLLRYDVYSPSLVGLFRGDA